MAKRKKIYKTLIWILFKWILCDDYDFIMIISWAHIIYLYIIYISFASSFLVLFLHCEHVGLVRDLNIIQMISVFANFVISVEYLYNLIKNKTSDIFVFIYSYCCWKWRQWNHTHSYRRANRMEMVNKWKWKKRTLNTHTLKSQQNQHMAIQCDEFNSRNRAKQTKNNNSNGHLKTA